MYAKGASDIPGYPDALVLQPTRRHHVRVHQAWIGQVLTMMDHVYITAILAVGIKLLASFPLPPTLLDGNDEEVIRRIVVPLCPLTPLHFQLPYTLRRYRGSAHRCPTCPLFVFARRTSEYPSPYSFCLFSSPWDQRSSSHLSDLSLTPPCS
ncbi:hypothetical protein GGR55DRAFT_638014 [Xylaria sp. FL0064]|nr:hypothetical protein GGR55DRAFT_638014 [Xylaria sp. FL0064]